ncbi:MAG: SDR family oxidoreductase [bacterium]|nr:SDR family oxidoreductase [bacterium]
MGKLENRVALVTGGASGIGAAIAERFLAEDAKVVVIDRDEKSLETIKETLPELSLTISTDVSDVSAVKNAFKLMEEANLLPDVLANNAGISIRHDFLDITPEEWQNVININLNGVFYVAQEAAKAMQKMGGGVIINMGSTNGIAGYPYYIDYNASKAGVIELTRSMALELAPDIRVNTICPGYILTPMQEAEYTPEMLAECIRKTPLKRLGKPEEVAALYAFLASDEASWITGQQFVIDGGELAGGLASR